MEDNFGSGSERRIVGTRLSSLRGSPKLRQLESLLPSWLDEACVNCFVRIDARSEGTLAQWFHEPMVFQVPSRRSILAAKRLSTDPRGAIPRGASSQDASSDFAGFASMGIRVRVGVVADLSSFIAQQMACASRDDSLGAILYSDCNPVDHASDFKGRQSRRHRKPHYLHN